MPDTRERTLRLTERPEIPWLSVVLGYGPMIPFVAGALASWLSAGAWRTEFVGLTIVWAGSILAFLAGVRRGLSFRTEGGPTPAQIITMFCLYVLALAALALGFNHLPLAATPLLLVGYFALQVLDPIAARTGEAPLFFARLRPPQLSIAVASLVALLVSVALR